MAALVTGAFGCIGAWACRRPLEEAWPSAKGTATHVEQALPFPSGLTDPGYQRELEPVT
jgi:hypothetical protein